MPDGSTTTRAKLELPPFFRVLRGGPLPRGLGHRTSEPGDVVA
jgi:hypothetical protein